LLTHFFEDDSRIMKTVAKQTGKVIDITSWKNKVIAEVKPNIVICGHTHVPTLELGVEYKIKNKTYKFDVLNPGTANVEKNRSKTFTNATYIVGTINDGKKPNWKIVKIV
jgi:predicted phosphodiesterase